MTALRPLYLDRGAAAVRLEGPALIVDQPDAAEGRFPLRTCGGRSIRHPTACSVLALKEKGLKPGRTGDFLEIKRSVLALKEQEQNEVLVSWRARRPRPAPCVSLSVIGLPDRRPGIRLVTTPPDFFGYDRFRGTRTRRARRRA